ncbi:initiator tRNA phosphoribosyl transferase-domain-containing protein [Pavlovales sp. CCMP2436]|nr:initiator tRNA phosphoribosyl transferase-domain-containing protein [Pavlovales sp. CCMP2436]
MSTNAVVSVPVPAGVRVGRVAAADKDEDDEFALIGAPRKWHKELRSIRQRERTTTANYVLSLLHDAGYVERAAAAARPWPLLANLRAGAWYAPPALRLGTCYFKSTDGHAGTWGFSMTRLNWHAAMMAAEKGGLVIVDATRRGKRFPDSLCKTIPIWCAVLNLLAEIEPGGIPGGHLGKSTPPASRVLPDWPLALPNFLSASEADQIRSRLPDFSAKVTS